MFWNKTQETISGKKLEELQLKKLRFLLKSVSKHPFYKRYKDVQLNKLSDLQKISFTSKKDIQRYPNLDFFNSPLKDIVDIHSTTGTTSKPIFVGYTKKDLETWSELTARVLVAGGLAKQDLAQNMLGYGLFNGGLAMHKGAEKIGATIVPSSNGNTLRQINLIIDLGVTAVISSPSYVLHIIDVADKHARDIKNSKLKTGFLTGETWTENMRREIESGLNIKSYDNYGQTEVFGPGIAYECQQQKGMHVSEDHFLVEVINPKTKEVLSPGEKGELVFTSLTKQGFPVIRFRTGDISKILEEKCPCGRTFRRIQKITGRTDDLLTINGNKIFPSQIEDLLGDEKYATYNYEVIIEQKNHKDELTMLIETPHLLRKHPKEILIIEEEMAERMKASMSVNVKVKLLKPGAISCYPGKKKRVIDKRKE